MKFIPLGIKRFPYDYQEDIQNDTDTGKPRHIPSYYDTAKKAKKQTRKPGQH